MTDGRFEVTFGDHQIVGDRLGSALPLQALVLHGAGEANRARMQPLREKLLERNIGSVAFDFIGHGDTGGGIEESSLMSRTLQASAVIDNLRLADRRRIAVIAASMGGHNAVRLLKRYPIDRLVLLAPAAYSRRAYSVPFTDEFSKVIRIENSWRDSEVWDILPAFLGKLLVVSGELDRIIPADVITGYYRVAKNAVYRRIYTVKNVGHMMFTELREKRPEETDHVVELILKVIL